MLLLTITRDPQSESRSAFLLAVSRETKGETFSVASYKALGQVRETAEYAEHRVILNDSFQSEDVEEFGRYGIVELRGEPEREPLYIAGGKPEGADAPETPGLLRLSREDHRHLLFLLRSDDSLLARVEAGEPVEGGTTAPLLARLAQIAAVAGTAAAPFAFASQAAAQCEAPTGGQNGSASGAGYTGIDSKLIQTQEGGTLTGNVPTGSSGVTFFGLDLGMQSASTLTNKYGLSPSLVQQFSPFLGKIGPAAVSAFNANPNNQTITTAQQQQIYNQVYPVYYAAAAASFNMLAQQKGLNFQFSQMNVQWQSVVASMYFQGAGPSPGLGSKFMQTNFASQIVNQQWSAATANLKNFNGPSSAQNNRALSNYNYLQKHNCTSGNQ
jgi:hypothetical protein